MNDTANRANPTFPSDYQIMVFEVSSFLTSFGANLGEERKCHYTSEIVIWAKLDAQRTAQNSQKS